MNVDMAEVTLIRMCYKLTATEAECSMCCTLKKQTTALILYNLITTTTAFT